MYKNCTFGFVWRSFHFLCIYIYKFCRPSLEDVAEEWAHVPTFGLQEKGKKLEKVKTMSITADEAFCHLRSLDLPSSEVSFLKT